ncbi:hypothetical protein OU426_12565 [Frigidibacter sp. RF13]|uniref:hypothetical protein n=1 Tax=Frigidibacter sp. RF13 TaxID=2997340 RepID=UPI0022713765|nr:hypothetical protein [Frigidibacter sp. RF13]MCY1127689.1 hypothetical protein [Frigidibacter sp. RF13]
MLNPLSLAIVAGIVVASPVAACVARRFVGEAQPEGQPAFPVVVTVNCKEGAVSGQVESQFGTNPIIGGQSEEARLAIEIDQDGFKISLSAERSGSAWRGRFAAGPRNGTLELFPIRPPVTQT